MTMMKQISTMLMIVYIIMMVACTRETKLPNDQMGTAVSPTMPTVSVTTPTIEPIAVSATAPATMSVSTSSAAVQTDAPLLFSRDNDLWRADLNGQHEQRLTTGNMLADWFALNEGGDFWWTGGFPPQIHVSPDGRWLAFTQTGRNLVLVDVTGQEAPRIHDLTGWASIFTWAPDSQQLAYSSQTGIFLYDVATDSFQRLLAQGGKNLVWSPDGRFLAFSCCFSETEPGPYAGTYSGKVRQVALATQQVTNVGETWIGIASGPPPLCWSATGTVGIDVADPLLCSYERPYPFAPAPDGEKTAVLAARTPEDDALFRLLLVKSQATDATLWQQEVPQVQTVYWSPDGQTLLLGNSTYNVADAAVWRIPADGSEPAQLLLSAALLLDVIPQWHAE